MHTLYSNTRDLADIADHLNEAVQMLRCLRPQCLDLQSEDGVDVGVAVRMVESLVTAQQDLLAGLVSMQLSSERQPAEESLLRVAGTQN